MGAQEAPGQTVVLSEERAGMTQQVVGDFGLPVVAVGADHAAIPRGVGLG